MPSTLPSRWQEILRQEAAANVGEVLSRARQGADSPRLPRWSAPAAVVGVASVSLLSLLGSSEARGRGGVPFDRATLISTRTAGLGASAEDLAPPRREPEAIAQSSSTIPPTEAVEPAPKRPLRARVEATPPPQHLDRDKRQQLQASPAPMPEPEPEPTPSPVAEKVEPVVVNIGTRLQALLAEPLVTGAALAPATAKLAADFYVGERLVLAAGTPLVGEGFSTQQDDRVQVVFSAFVRDGKTLQFEGWALQDSEMGVKGKVIRKGSKAKKGGGAILGAAASALTFGLAGIAPGPTGAALSSLGNSAGSGLHGLGRDWRWSDKAVRVEAGAPITIYVRRDLKIE